MAKFLDSSGLQYFWNKIKSAMSGKQDTITDLSEIRSGAQAGSTALQSFTESDPTVPSWAKQESKPSYTKSEVGLGNVPNVTTNNQTPTYTQATSRANLSSGETLSTALGKIAKWFADLKSVAFSGSYNDLSDKPTIPSSVTKSTVSGWGFIETESDPVFTASAAHNIASSDISNWNSKGTYSKPSGGIPKTDLASAVQTSLGRADSALQSFTETDPVFSASAAHGISSSDITNWNSKGTYSKPSGGIPKSDLASAVQTSLGRADTAVQPETGKGLFSGSYNDLTDKPTIPAEVTESTVSGWGFTKNTGTYSKPTGGIPKTDLASAVQTSLGRADTALQSFTETDPVFSASPAVGITASDISAWNGKQNALSTAQLNAANSGITASKVSTYDGYATTISGKEPSVAAGTSSQYWRGDKTWQTLNKSAVGLGNVQNVSVNRSTNVNAADTNYSTLMARGEKLLAAATFDGVSDWTTQLVNGAIAWKYE